MFNPGAGVDDSGMLRLTVPDKNRQGAFIVEDFDEKRKVIGFVADFKMLIGGGGNRGADGMSFNFARQIPPSIGEAGSETGLVISFDTYKEASGPPEILVKYFNETLKTVELAKLRTGNVFVDVQIKLATNKLLTVTYDGRLLLECEVTDYKPLGGAEFGFGARTGSSFDSHVIDELSIVTTVERKSGPNSRSTNPVPQSTTVAKD